MHYESHESPRRLRVGPSAVDWTEAARARRRARVLRSEAFHELVRGAWTRVRRAFARTTTPADCEPVGACA